MNIENLTHTELIRLYFDTCKKLGWHSVMTLCVEDVEKELEEAGIEIMPSREHIKAACEYVACKAEVDDSHIYDWAVSKAIEIAQEKT